jgi:hypothetical protein
MLAATSRETIYYRCLARTIAPGSPMLADHPRTVGSVGVNRPQLLVRGDRTW